jgi:hypothetical protein
MENSDIDSLTNEFNTKLKITFEQLEKEQGKFINAYLDYVTHRRHLTTTAKPKIAVANPFRVHLEKDKDYFYCVCGYSKLQVG